ncbi:UPF0053 protein YrkA [Candidatus Protochlamydia amoebophila]|uniref:hemolysin family protein n=1 Tax=Candidatus Protochlamydia amoebophila TaxID=362787 RepID=UPI001BC902C5|nr:hemolysin family protein [Candidatus Protochlamydia amoebophila]MBS4164204.1 UPF0053 protein YrkA [Candidatus Protochlamydia amoebophila]
MFEILLILMCLILNAFLAGAETAFIAVSKSTLREWIKKGHARAKLLLTLRENPERTLSVIQIGITFLGAFAAALGGAGAEETITPWLTSTFRLTETLAEILSLMIVVVPLTFVSVVVGELVPKTLALRRPLFFASKSAPWLFQASRFISPIVSSLEWSTKMVLASFPKHHIVSEESQEESNFPLEHLSTFNKQYIFNIVKVEKTTVREIFVSWPEVVSVNSAQTLSEVENIVISSGHTRLPVLQGQEVIGIINAKEFLAFQKTGQQNWMSIVRPPLKIEDKLPILSALRFMQDHRSHMAIVYQGKNKSGIVTMEAIFEEIVGDIYDEEDDGSLKRILGRSIK